MMHEPDEVGEPRWSMTRGGSDYAALSRTTEVNLVSVIMSIHHQLVN
jgi:hypothetical protein